MSLAWDVVDMYLLSTYEVPGFALGPGDAVAVALEKGVNLLPLSPTGFWNHLVYLFVYYPILCLPCLTMPYLQHFPGEWLVFSVLPLPRAVLAHSVCSKAACWVNERWTELTRWKWTNEQHFLSLSVCLVLTVSPNHPISSSHQCLGVSAINGPVLQVDNLRPRQVKQLLLALVTSHLVL